MKILFVIPVKGRHQYISFGVGYLSSYLKKYGSDQIEVALADENAGDDVIKKFNRFAPDIVGISSTTPQIIRAIQITKEIRKLNKNTIIIIGGIHASVLPERTLIESPEIDIVVIGEGEETLNEICNLYIRTNGEFKDDLLVKIRGIAFRAEDGRIIITGMRDVITNLDTVPFPDWDLFNMKYYLAPQQLIRGFPAKRALNILTSRGCPYRCKFCSSNILAKKYRPISAELVVGEIGDLIDRYNIGALYLHDDLFIANRERVNKFCEQLIERGYNKKIVWACQVRANLINEGSIPLLRKMKEAGCVQMEFGFESGSNRVLIFLKNVAASVEQNQKSIDIVKECGIRIFGNFMIGSVTETEHELAETEKFIEKNINKIDFFQVYITVPYPGTALWDICKERGLLQDDEKFENFFLYNGDNISRSFNETIPQNKLNETVQRLNYLAIKNMPLIEKLLWAAHSLFKDPYYVFNRTHKYIKCLIGSY